MKRAIHVTALCLCLSASAAPAKAEPSREEVLSAMKRASAFMMDEVSMNGGFLWQYSEDLSERWGEVPARESQIWVQGATNGVGELFLDIWRETGERTFLEYARRTAGAIVWGQHPSGGWHYFIDFDMTGIERWYDEVGSRCWGWEEHNHYYGNCTFDNDSTTSSVRFLLHLYMETLDPAWRGPLLRGLEFILESQYPNGAWPQRYPLRYEYVKQGRPDYTSHYTLNDGVAFNNIRLLFEAWEQLGDERYRTAAIRGMDFHLIAQGPPEQPAWAEQYSRDLKPAWARTYEPDAWHAGRTVQCCRELMTFHRMTGDRRYLEPIPAALDWLERSTINTDPSRRAERAGMEFPYTHAVYYEQGTNRPLYVHREGTDIDDGRYRADYTFGDCPCHVLQVLDLNITALRNAYERTAALSPEEAMAEYGRSRGRTRRRTVEGGAVETAIASLDERGAWITDMTIRNFDDPCDFSGERHIRGIETEVFLDTMRLFLDFLRSGS